jgi:dipeptidyl aminopeptidase/acylaminoacyl peptidase
MTARCIAPWLLGATLSIAVAGADAALRPIQHEDLWLLPRVGAPIVSPDGRWAVVGVAEPAYDDKLKSSDLWLLRIDGASPPRRLTQTPGAESGVSWSEDSGRIVFAAKRGSDEADQVYVLDLAGGEARRLTTLVGGARNPKFSPDGRRIALETNAWPGTATEEDNRKAHQARKDRKYNARVYTGFPIRQWDRWIDGRQPRLLVLDLAADGGPAGEPRDLLANTALVKASGYAGRRGDSGDNLDIAWAPDGSGLVFTASANAHTGAFAIPSTGLYWLPIAGTEPRRLTPDTHSCGQATFAPNGLILLAACDQLTEFVYNHTRLAALSWPAPGTMRMLTAGFDRSVGSFGVSGDSRTIWLLAEEDGNEKLFSVPLAGGKVGRHIDLRDGVYSGLTVANRSRAPVLVAAHQNAVAPAEVVRIDPATRQHRVLSDFARSKVKPLDLPALESFSFTSAQGRQIQNFLVRPPGFDPNKKYPLFVVIHGGPHTMFRNEWGLRWNYHMLASPGYVILLTNYSGSTGFGEQAARSIQRDPLRTAGEELNQAADEAIRRYAFIDASRQCAGGASYGGHLSNWLQASTTRYRCLVSHAGLINLESQYGTSDSTYPRELNNGGPVWEQGPVWREQNPIRYAAKFQTPTLVTIGEQDFRVPLNNSLEYWTILQRRQIESRLVVFPDENHWVLKGENSRLFFQEIHGWLARWLK